MSDFAIGCSHTFGLGVKPHEAWPSLLNLKNYGVNGCSTDYVARVMPELIKSESPKRIFVLWPDWTRFEYVVNGHYLQSLPTDSNRIKFMPDWPEERLKENFQQRVNEIKALCSSHGIKLIALTLDDLCHYIDYPDKWPISELGHHYAPEWHRMVADIFKRHANALPPTLCMAPWTHTYLSPQTERRMCCASREPAQNFEQYIDTSSGTGKYIPITLEEHWNSEHMKSVRRRMMAGETLPECDVCNNKLLNTDVYRSYFGHLFGHKYKDIWDTTDSTGYTTMMPVSWDYRFSNLCNFKCRTCGDMLSSAWESEERQHDMINWHNPKNNWMLPEVKKQIEEFQATQIEQEFADAVEQHRIEEVYWVGGEPLMYEQHWRYMSRIIELGDGPNVYARYNTNLSRVVHRGVDLYDDILSGLRDWQICASIDGTSRIGEYIRTGLRYDTWRENFARGVGVQRHARQMRIDFTLTLPGMFEIDNIVLLAKEFGTEILAKVIFSFSPDIVMSPLALPREILHPWVDEILHSIDKGALHDTLVQLKTRPTFAEQWPDEYEAGLRKGKQRILTLEKIRGDSYTMDDILRERADVYEWWKSID